MPSPSRSPRADVLLVQLEIPVETALHALEVGREAGVRTILNPAPAPPYRDRSRGRLPDAERDARRSRSRERTERSWSRSASRARGCAASRSRRSRPDAGGHDRRRRRVLRRVRRRSGRGRGGRRCRPLGLRRRSAHGRARRRHSGPADARPAPGTASRWQPRDPADRRYRHRRRRRLLAADRAPPPAASRSRRSPSAAATSASTRRSRTRCTRSRQPAAPARSPSTQAVAEPLIAEWVGAEYVHGQDGMGDSFFPRATQRPEPEHAVDELVRRIEREPGRAHRPRAGAADEPRRRGHARSRRSHRRSRACT